MQTNKRPKCRSPPVSGFQTNFVPCLEERYPSKSEPGENRKRKGRTSCLTSCARLTSTASHPSPKATLKQVIIQKKNYQKKGKSRAPDPPGEKIDDFRRSFVERKQAVEPKLKEPPDCTSSGTVAVGHSSGYLNRCGVTTGQDPPARDVIAPITISNIVRDPSGDLVVDIAPRPCQPG
jgi:hypothetical protein